MRAHLARLLGAVLALSVLAAALVGGRSYFRCEAMKAAMLEPCCEHEQAEPGEQAQASESGPTLDESTPPCCAARTFAGHPGGRVAGAPDELQAAPLAAVLAFAACTLPVTPGLAVGALARAIREGPRRPPVVHTELRVVRC